MISFQLPAILWQACWLCCFRIVSANMHSAVSFSFRVEKKKKKKKKKKKRQFWLGQRQAQPQNCIIFLQHQICWKCSATKENWHQSPMFAFFAVNICPCKTWRQFGHCKITCCFHSHLSYCSKMLACLWLCKQRSAVCFQPTFCTNRYLQLQLLWHSHKTSSSSCKWPLSKYWPACHFGGLQGKRVISLFEFWQRQALTQWKSPLPRAGLGLSLSESEGGVGPGWGGRDKLFQSLMVFGGKL